jgi:hypothetical protein
MVPKGGLEPPLMPGCQGLFVVQKKKENLLDGLNPGNSEIIILSAMRKGNRGKHLIAEAQKRTRMQ